jgi:hypothetical protein
MGFNGQTISIKFEVSKLQKNANPYAHVKLFQTIVRANGKTSKEYIINAFNYTLRKMASNWCHN